MMARFAGLPVLDAGLDTLASADRLLVLAGQPADFAAAVATPLATAVLLPAAFAKAGAPGGGRQLTVAANPGLLALATGTADHVALVDGVGARLLYVATCPPQPVLAGGAVNVAAWTVTAAPPV
jgi:hypothetical protein